MNVLGLNFTIETIQKTQCNFKLLLVTVDTLRAQLRSVLSNDTDSLDECIKLVELMKRSIINFETKMLVTIHEAVLNLHQHLHLYKILRDETIRARNANSSSSTTTTKSNENANPTDADSVERLMQLIRQQLSVEFFGQQQQQRIDELSARLERQLERNDLLQTTLHGVKDQLHNTQIEQLRQVARESEMRYTHQQQIERLERMQKASDAKIVQQQRTIMQQDQQLEDKNATIKQKDERIEQMHELITQITDNKEVDLREHLVECEHEVLKRENDMLHTENKLKHFELLAVKCEEETRVRMQMMDELQNELRQVDFVKSSEAAAARYQLYQERAENQKKIAELQQKIDQLTTKLTEAKLNQNSTKTPDK